MPRILSHTSARRRGSRCLSCCALGAAALANLCLGAPRTEVSWRDLEGRIQYGYYTEDVPALRGLGDTIAADESRGMLHGYYAALLAWRLAQLAGETPAEARAATAGHLAQRCVSELDETLAAAADFAEGLALRAACLVTEAADTHGAHAVRRARRDLARAQRLAAHNPRILLIDGLSDYQLPSELGGNKERALGKLRQAVAAYEAERAGTEPLPGWGAAEAYLLLARDLLDHGEALGARDALEHALLIAPDFVPARRLMAHIISG
jgi:hypothetical protein